MKTKTTTMTTQQQQQNNNKATQPPPHISSVTKMSCMFLGALIMLLFCCMSCFIPSTTTSASATATTNDNVDQLGPYFIIFCWYILVCVGVIVTQAQVPSTIAVNVTISGNSTCAATSSDEEDEEEEEDEKEEEDASITANGSDETDGNLEDDQTQHGEEAVAVAERTGDVVAVVVKDDDQTEAEAVVVSGTGDEAAATDQVAADFERLFPVWVRAMIKTLPDMNKGLVCDSCFALAGEFGRLQDKIDPAITAEVMPCFAALARPGALTKLNISLTELGTLMSEFASAFSSLSVTGTAGGGGGGDNADPELTIDDGGGNPASVTICSFTEEDIGLVMSQSQVSRDVAIMALMEFKGQVVDAIMYLAENE